jgi:hypothetical protein
MDVAGPKSASEVLAQAFTHAPQRRLNKPGCCEWAARTGRVAFAAEVIRFALDSALEGDGFEPSVPRGETLFSNRLINGSAQCTRGRA